MEVHADADGERHAHRIGAAERDAEDQLQYLVDRQDEQQRGEDGQRGRDEPEEVVIRRGSLFGETQIGFDHSSGLSVWNRLWSVGPQDVGVSSYSVSADRFPQQPFHDVRLPGRRVFSFDARRGRRMPERDDGPVGHGR